MSYGFCYTCGAPVVSRTRGGLNSMDTCERGHTNLAVQTRKTAVLYGDGGSGCVEGVKEPGPVAVRYDFDGNGWRYMDFGSGSDWLKRAMTYDGAEPLYEGAYGDDAKEWERQAIYHNKQHGERTEELRLLQLERDTTIGRMNKEHEEAIASLSAQIDQCQRNLTTQTTRTKVAHEQRDTLGCVMTELLQVNDGVPMMGVEASRRIEAARTELIKQGFL